VVVADLSRGTVETEMKKEGGKAGKRIGGDTVNDRALRYQVVAVVRGKVWAKLPFPPHTLLWLSQPCIRPPLLTSSSSNMENLYGPSLFFPS